MFDDGHNNPLWFMGLHTYITYLRTTTGYFPRGGKPRAAGVHHVFLPHAVCGFAPDRARDVSGLAHWARRPTSAACLATGGGASPMSSENRCRSRSQASRSGVVVGKMGCLSDQAVEQGKSQSTRGTLHPLHGYCQSKSARHFSI